MKTWAIRNVDVRTENGVQTGRTIVIEGHRIRAIEANPTLPADCEIWDGQGMLAMPGLVNSHTHVAMTLFRSYADDVALMDWLQNHIWPAEEKLTDELVYWGAQWAFAEMIRGGTTAFSDMYMHMDAVAEAAVAVGMRGNLARGLAGVSPNAAAALAENIELHRKWHGAEDGLLRVMLGPHAPYTCPADYLKQVVAAAEKEDMEIHIHLSETQGEVATCKEKHGMSPIAWMEHLGVFSRPTLAAHCVHVDAADIDIMARHHVRVAHNPRSNLKLASGVAPVPQMRAAGVVVGLATDGASSNNKLSMFDEMQYAALIHKGVQYDPFAISAGEALAMATREGARALGYDDLGELAPGMLADLILLDRSGFHWEPCYHIDSMLAYAAQPSDVDSVVIHGKPVMRRRELLTIDTEKVRAEMQRAKEYFAGLH